MNGTDNDGTTTRGAWGSKLGFVLAAAGSAIGLGNIWRFPYITGEYGGGLFVLIYLFCIAIIGLPIMIGEIMLGRMTQKSPVGAFGSIAGDRSPWKAVGGMGVLAAFFMLSFYSVVAGWALHYTWLSVTGGITGGDPQRLLSVFDELHQDAGLNLLWHVLFMALTALVVIGGIHKGIERWSQILMPLLFVMLLALLVNATTMDGWDEGWSFVFGTHHADKLFPEGVLEALGHSFFTLSLGMGAMITYGSYLTKRSSLIANSVSICILDTLIALCACLILFPVTFSYGMAPDQEIGLVFKNMPAALAQMPGSQLVSIVFFGLLVFAALTSSISLLEVVTSYFIDQRRWSRRKSTITCAAGITVFGIPSALSGSVAWAGTWFGWLTYIVSSWMLPLGGLFIALFCAWRVGDKAREAEFLRHSQAGRLYRGWLILLRYVVPLLVVAVLLYAAGILNKLGILPAK